MNKTRLGYFFSVLMFLFATFTQANEVTFKAGHKSLKQWRLGDVPYPENNKPNKLRVELGKKLFFDPRLSGDGNMSCASCHNPLFGWSDGLKTAKGFQSQVLQRASPTIINTAYNSLQMWDGRKETLEHQALGPMASTVEMNVDIPKVIEWLSGNAEYKTLFKNAYPKEGVTQSSLAKAIASFERTVISNQSPFDKWVAGNKRALTKEQVSGFKVFMDPKKGNCAVCHSAPNFTDDGFHNVGLASFSSPDPDLGRYNEKPIRILKGAFKTPTLRDISYTAPYFHDGSAKTLMEVVDHYIRGGEKNEHLSPNMKPLTLTESESQALVAFLQSLSSPRKPFVLPILPL